MRHPFLVPFVALSILVSLVGCRRDEVRTYTVAKDPASPAASSSSPAAAAMPASASAADADAMMRNTAVTTAQGPGLAWTAPGHWTAGGERPMRKATFTMSDDYGATAELAVTAFPGNVGGNLANVNRWRQQLGVGPVSEAELGGLLQHIHVGAFHIDVAELTAPGTPPAKRVLGAIVPYQGSTWFFKLEGPDALVLREKPAFYAFLQTLRPQS